MYEVKDEVIKNIINEFEKELDKRYYEYSENALDKIVNEWVTRKQNLLELLSKHPLWNPDKLMIQFDQDYDRRIELGELSVFCNWLRVNITTEYGKSLTELNCTEDEDDRRKDIIYWINEHVKTQFFNESMKEEIDKINSYNDNYKLRTNAKATKAIGKICRVEGWDKLEGYNQRFSALCDNMNPIKVKRHTVISLNPLDFLLMSNGDSWESCHYIGDSCNDSGCYSSGTISYMLDECSFVFYTVDSSFNGENIELAEKSQRQIFGYNDEVFIQSRLYPQANDSGAESVYDDIRHIVQKIIADCLNKPNLWTVSRDLDNINDVVKKGYDATCYPDWHRGCPGSSHVSLSTLKSRKMIPKSIILGAKPICISCGYRHDYTENISCCKSDGYYCTECGQWIDEDDVYWVGDDPYCGDCVVYCERCDCCVPYNDAIRVNGSYYCQDCVDEHAYKCDNCGEYVFNDYDDDVITTEEGHIYCRDCADDKAFYCEECCEYHDIDCGIEVEGDWYCKDCIDKIAVKCESCNEYIYKENAIITEDGHIYCEDCADDKAFECESCNEWFTKENGFYDEYTDSWYCKVCYEELLKEREESEDDLDEKAI